MLVVRRLSQRRAQELHKTDEHKLLITGPNGEEIIIDILGTEGERVKIGVTAPPDYEIARAELKLQDHGGYDGNHCPNQGSDQLEGRPGNFADPGKHSKRT